MYNVVFLILNYNASFNQPEENIMDANYFNG